MKGRTSIPVTQTEAEPEPDSFSGSMASRFRLKVNEMKAWRPLSVPSVSLTTFKSLPHPNSH
jgi:hypothetical protein